MRTALCLLLAALPAPALAGEAEVLPAFVSEAVKGAVAVADARFVPLSYAPSLPRGCQPTDAQVPHPIEGSGRVAVKLSGRGCTGSAWVRLQVFAPVPVTTRLVRAGEKLAGGFTTAEREILASHPPAAFPPPDAVAARNLSSGQMIEAAHVRGAGSAAGTPVKVIVRAGPIVIETQGRSVPCGRGRSCAVLPSGKHVEGQLAEGRLLVELR